ncbi:MAG TPA: DUF3108 domain-containing protein [Candidatus Tenderia sp.]|nr:DUF3108 domain-containing protein [Candidatus Tenderia sp.]
MIRQLTNGIVAAGLFILASTSWAQEAGETATPTGAQPVPFTAVYLLTSGPLTLGKMTRTLSLSAEGHYIYNSHSKPIGYAKWFVSTELRERSEWILHDGQPRPLSYRYDRTGDKKRERHVHIRFDWEKMRVINSINNDPWQMSIPADTLDKLLYHLAVVYDLQQGKTTLSYHVADGGKLKTHTFEIIGNEQITTPLGTFNTLKLKTPGKRDTIIWCAPELDYLPVQLEQKEKRGSLTMQMTSLEWQ